MLTSNSLCLATSRTEFFSAISREDTFRNLSCASESALSLASSSATFCLSESKQPTAYWRGSASDGSASGRIEQLWLTSARDGSHRGSRARLAALSLMYPRLIDARLTAKGKRPTYGPRPSANLSSPGVWTVVPTGVAPSPFFDAFDHKYVIDVSGVGGPPLREKHYPETVDESTMINFSSETEC